MSAERWERLARRVVLGTAAATAVLLLLAMGLSYTGLRAFYLGAGFPTAAASLFPLPVDLLFPIGFVALLVLPRGRKWYAGLVVAFSGIVSAAAQGYHQSHGGVSAAVTTVWVLFAAGASAMVCALIAGHLLWLILERALPAGFIAAMRADAPVYDAVPEQKTRPTGGRVSDGQPTSVEPDRTAERVLADMSRPLPPPVREIAQQPARLHSVALRSERPASQETGPCIDGCDKHPAGTAVSKSTRYRCAERVRKVANDG